MCFEEIACSKYRYNGQHNLGDLYPHLVSHVSSFNKQGSLHFDNNLGFELDLLTISYVKPMLCPSASTSLRSSHEIDRIAVESRLIKRGYCSHFVEHFLHCLIKLRVFSIS
jgi:hypothetical protein